MPVANIQWAKATFEDPNQIGEQPTPAGFLTNKFPLFDTGRAKVLFDYTVPAGKVLSLANLLFAPIPPDSIYAIAGTPTEAGKAYLLVDGTTKFEGRLQPCPINSATTPRTVPYRARCRMSLGEGVDFTSGQVLKLQAEPVSAGPFSSGASLPTKWTAALHGEAVSGGAVDIQRGVLRTPPRGTATDILSYTVPANGLRLFWFDVMAWSAEALGPSVQVFINGALVLEAGYVSLMREQTCFNSGDQGRGCWSIGGLGSWGLQLRHGDRVLMLGHAYLDWGQAVGVQLPSMEEAMVTAEAVYQAGVI